MPDVDLHDVIIVGGSYAGLSAAMTLGRSLRKVLVIDSGLPCNRQTPFTHNLITHDGEPPAQITILAKEQVLAYPNVAFQAGKVVKVDPVSEGFALQTEQGQRFSTKKVLLATGVLDILPAIEGFAPCWGISILHCPYCHGYEVKGQPIGLLANGEVGVELVRLINHWSQNLTVLTNGPATFSGEQRRFIEQLNIPFLEVPVAQFVHQDGQLQEVQFEDGSRVSLTAIFTRVPFGQPSDLAQQLGCALTQTGPFSGLIKTDEVGKTTVEGVWAAGDNSTYFRSVGVAISHGLKAGVGINRELLDESLPSIASASPPVHVWSEQERAYLLDQLDESTKQLQAVIAPLSAEPFFARTDASTWSVADVVEHLSLIERAFAREFFLSTQLPPMPQYATHVSADDTVTLQEGQRSTGQLALTTYSPQRLIHDKAGYVKMFVKERTEFLALVRDTKANLRTCYSFRHNPEGGYRVLDLYQLVLYVVGHTKRHTEQIRRLISQSVGHR